MTQIIDSKILIKTQLHKKSKGDFVLKNHFESFVLKISDRKKYILNIKILLFK